MRSAVNRYPHVSAAIFETPWLITPKAMQRDRRGHRAPARRWSADRRRDRERLAVGRADRRAPRGAPSRAGNVAVIPVYGVPVASRSNLMSEMSGGTSVQSTRSAHFAHGA
jgi:hypothetical protein